MNYAEMTVGVVIPVGDGRLENLRLVLAHLMNGTERPEWVVIVCDGLTTGVTYESLEVVNDGMDPEVIIVECKKHQPGMEQPRNVGVRVLQTDDISHVWFLDSDVLPAYYALAGHKHALNQVGFDAISIGPYDWLPPGIREPREDIHSDQRWPMFRDRGVGPFVADLGVALGCFSGNLMWPIDRFVEVGGFHPALHHGRCEDGELGLRAAAHRIPMGLAISARGWHLDHPRNHEEIIRRNARDVPLINEWHPWVEQEGLILTEEDGVRFDFQCTCGQRMNTLEMWRHFSFEHGPQDNEMLILPDGL